MFPSPVLKGIETMAPPHGYVLTTPKPTASVVLQVPPLAEQTAAGDAPDPLLATWHYGLGTTAAWTSDFAPDWARDWPAWEKYEPFLRQLVTEVSRVERASNLAVVPSYSSTQGVITVEDSARDSRFAGFGSPGYRPARGSP